MVGQGRPWRSSSPLHPLHVNVMIPRLVCRLFSTERIYTGLPRDPSAPRTLHAIYQTTSQLLHQLPDCYYRRTLLATMTERMGQLERGEQVTETWREGRMEEVVEQARRELAMIQRMTSGEWRPWEELECPPPAGQWTN